MNFSKQKLNCDKKNNNDNLKDLSKLLNINNESEKIIKEKNIKIKKLEKTIDKLHNIISNLNIEILQKKNIDNLIVENTKILKNINIIIEIIINYFKNIDLQYSIYGTFLENLFSDNSINFTEINVFLKNIINMGECIGLLNILKTLNKIKNIKNYDLLKQYLDINNYNMDIYYYEIEIIVDTDKIITLIIHNGNYFYSNNNIYITSRNIEINNNGLSIINNKNIFTNEKSIEILNNLYYLKNKQIKIFKNDNLTLVNNNELLDVLEKTNKIKKTKNIKILNDFIIKKDKCCICFNEIDCYTLSCNHNFCLICINEHLNNDNYENKGCPLCRNNMILK